MVIYIDDLATLPSPSHIPHHISSPHQPHTQSLKAGGVSFTDTFSSLLLVTGPEISSQKMLAELNLSFRHCIRQYHHASPRLLCAANCSDKQFMCINVFNLLRNIMRWVPLDR